VFMTEEGLLLDWFQGSDYFPKPYQKGEGT
jgi:hypothetical protein